uniref:Conserved oligomeric Golgi complex subunit 6 n=1 Tax=Ditylenchus dipsaci TaxID=166011 RepID=A0A915DPW2_9BILA
MDNNANIQARIESLICSKLEEDEKFVDSIAYLEKLNGCDSSITDERRLRIALEDRELELNQLYLENFQKINVQVQSFVDKLGKMNEICHNLTNRIQSNKEKTRDLLKRTGYLQSEKEELTAKQEYLNEFFSKYSLSDEENKSLVKPKTDGTLSDGFFKAFKHLNEIYDNVTHQLEREPDNLTFVEIKSSLQGKIEVAYEPVVHQSLELLQSRPKLFENALNEYGGARRSNVVRSYIDVLTKGGKSGQQKPIEQLSNEPLRYVSEMLAFISGSIANEREILTTSVLKNCRPESVSANIRLVLSNITEALCQPLKVRVEQIVSKESSSVVLYRLSSLFLYYAKSFESEINKEAVLVKVLYDLAELTQNMFFSVVSASVQRILSNMDVPDYDLLPVNAVHQALLLLRDILESQNDNAFAAVLDKKDMHAKIFMHILDPLHQSVQLVCSNLHNPLDVAVYMLNTMNTIRSVIILYQFTDTKLEMIKAQIDANEDVLVSEQASQVLTNSDLMDVYTKCLAHQPNQGPLSKITGMESERVASALTMFYTFLEHPEGFQCNQAIKISSARIRESVQKRTFENVVNAYTVIYQKLSQPENGYVEIKNLKTTEEVKKLLVK